MVKINSHVTKQGATNTRLVRQIAQEEAAATLTRLGSDHGGLKTDQVDQARAAYGPNRIEGHRKDSRLRFLAEAFLTPFTIVLLFLATLSLFANYIFVPAPQKDLSTVIIMVVMVLISGLTSFVQNVRTSNAVDKLLSLVSVNATVMRDGREEEIATSEVVVGDVVVLSAGDMVPADLRLLTTRDLFCSSSSLNGESTPVEKDATSKPQDLDDYLSYPNVLYEGTTVVSGSGTGVVFATGDSTVFGRLAREISQEGVKQTAFDKGMKDISRLLITMTLILAPVVFLINGLTKGNWLDALIFAIATAVGLTPEMLPVIVTSNLVKGSVEMSKHGTIVKKMNSIQNFGSADVLCTDKTGTLTQDKVVLERHYNLDLHENPGIFELAYLNSFYQTGMQDLMDKAIVQAAQEELDVSRIQKDYVKIDEVPFDFTRRRMSVVVQKSDGEHVLVTKGAAEEMLAACDRAEIDGRVEALTDERRKKVLADIEEMNEDGLRVILIGYKSDNEPAGSRHRGGRGRPDPRRLPGLPGPAQGEHPRSLAGFGKRRDQGQDPHRGQRGGHESGLQAGGVAGRQGLHRLPAGRSQRGRTGRHGGGMRHLRQTLPGTQDPDHHGPQGQRTHRGLYGGRDQRRSGDEGGGRVRIGGYGRRHRQGIGRHHPPA